MLSKSVINNIKMYYGEDGEAWISNFDSHLKSVFNKFKLELIKPYDNLSINFVAKVKLESGESAVLKTGYPSKEFITETKALRHFKSKAFVNLIDASPDDGVIILREVLPGESLASVKEDSKATEIAAHLMKGIWHKTENKSEYPDIKDWLSAFSKIRDRFDGATGPFDTKLFSLAESIKDELLESISDRVLLHGDLHHFNILKNKDEWLIIDPKGVIGEKEYELASFFKNPNDFVLKKENLTRIFNQRVDIFTDILKLDRHKVIRWAFVHGILSSLWNVDGPKQSWAKFEGWAQEISKIL